MKRNSDKMRNNTRIKPSPLLQLSKLPSKKYTQQK